MRKLFSFFAAILFAGSMMAAEPYTLTFTYMNKVDGDGSAKLSTKEAIFDAASQAYVQEVTTGSDVYAGRKYVNAAGDSIFSNLKLGTSSRAGQLTFTLAAAVEVDSIVFNAAMYGDAEGGDGFSVNGTQFTLSAGKLAFEECVLKPEGAVSTIDIVQTKADKGRFFLTSIVVYPKEGVTPVVPDKYYVIGSMTGWEVNAAYELKANPAAEGEYMGEFDFEANALLKVVKNEKETWYPDGMDNNYTIAEAGTYTVYFRPDGQGGEGWHYGFINAVKKEVPVVVEINCFEFYTKNVGDQVAMDELTVTYVNGANVYVKDATGALLIYLPKDVSVGWQPGSILKGVAGVVANYNGLYELKPSAVQVAAVEATLGEAPAPEEMTALPTAADVNKYVILKGVTVAATTFNDKKNLDATIAGQTFVLRNQFNADQVFEVNKVYDIIGAVAIYNDAIQIYFISAAGAEAIDNVDAAVKAVKAIENGRLVIIKNGVRYDATGARL